VPILKVLVKRITASRLFGCGEQLYHLSAIIFGAARSHLLCCEAATSVVSKEIREKTMRIVSILRIATLALSLTTATAGLSTAFAGDSSQQASPYDSPNFVIPQSQIFS